MTQRREVREIVLQALYAEEVSKDDWSHILKVIINKKLSKDKEAKKFAERLFLKTVKNKDTFDEVIQEHIKNWKIERLATLDKLLLRLALCEFLYFDDIPTKVTINEAIEIAKKYSTKKSGRFINGILDAALESLNEHDKISKSGRGLIETSVN